MIKDIQEEGKICIPCLITRCDKAKTVKGTPYLSLTLEDSSGVLDAKFWNLTEEQVDSYTVGMIVQATGDIIIHKNAYFIYHCISFIVLYISLYISISNCCFSWNRRWM